VVPGPVNVNVVVLIVLASIGTLNVAARTTPSATPTALLAGTVGGTTAGGGAVVKVHTKLAASGVPEVSFAPVVIVAVNKVLLARIDAGVNVAVLPVYVTAPATAVAPGPDTVKVVPVMVAAFIGTLNVAETRVLTGTAMAPFTGTVDITAGGGAVVNVHTTLAASGAPVGSFAPVVIVAVNNVLLARADVGVNVAVLPAYVTAPATGVAPGPVTVKVVPVMVAAFMGTLNVAETRVLTATAVAPFAGTVDVTVGGGAVVNVHTKLVASATPAGSFAPVVIVAVNNVLLARTVAGVNVAVEPE